MKALNPLQQFSRLINFLREVRVEGKRVNWPTRDKTVKDTIIVIIFAVVIALFLSAFDYGFQFILNTFVI